MNPQILVALVGLLSVAFGVAGLFYPHAVMQFSSLAPYAPTDPASAYGEIRAVYGGMPIALGAFTLWAATNPWRHRAVLNVVGTVFLGIFLGRMFGVATDGGPGLMGWVNAALELVAAGVLLAAPMFGSTPAALPSVSAAAPEPS